MPRATSHLLPLLSLDTYFYPRSPCGERLGETITRGQYIGISIHALLAESDQCKIDKQCSSKPFLSTLSLRRATGCQRLSGRPTTYFYPRSPCGERHNRPGLFFQYFSISIHALLAESDGASNQTTQQEQRISIHALLAESDTWQRGSRITYVISIHALLAESDAS